MFCFFIFCRVVVMTQCYLHTLCTMCLVHVKHSRVHNCHTQCIHSVELLLTVINGYEISLITVTRRIIIDCYFTISFKGFVLYD